MERLGFVTGSVVAVKAQSDAENGEVVVARLEGEVTLERYRRVDERRVQLRPESSNPEHQPIQIDLARDGTGCFGGGRRMRSGASWRKR